MSIQFGCSNCFNNLKVPDGTSGRKVKCPQCETVNTVPATEADGVRAAAPDQVSDGPQSAPPPPPVEAPQAPRSSPYPDVSAAPNPFQSPAVENYAQPDSLGPLTHQKVEMNDVLTQGWRRYKPHFGYGILFAVIAIAVQVCFGIGSTILQALAQFGGAAVGILAMIIAQVIQQGGGSYQQLLSKRFGLKLARGESEVLTGIFSFKHFGKLLGLFLLVLVISVAVMGVVAAPFFVSTILDDTGGLAPFGIGISAVLGLILIPLSIYYGLNYVLCIFFIVDRGSPLFESLKQSSAYMVGNKGTVFVTMLVASLAGGLGTILTCGFGLFVFFPLFESVQAVLYLKATGQYQDIAA